MDSTSKEIQFVTPKNKYTIFYYKIPVSFGSPLRKSRFSQFSKAPNNYER